MTFADAVPSAGSTSYHVFVHLFHLCRNVALADEVASGVNRILPADIDGLDVSLVERLGGVVHQGRHLAESSTHKFLNRRRPVRILFFRLG